MRDYLGRGLAWVADLRAILAAVLGIEGAVGLDTQYEVELFTATTGGGSGTFSAPVTSLVVENRGPQPATVQIDGGDGILVASGKFVSFERFGPVSTVAATTTSSTAEIQVVGTRRV